MDAIRVHFYNYKQSSNQWNRDTKTLDLENLVFKNILEKYLI